MSLLVTSKYKKPFPHSNDKVLTIIIWDVIDPR